MFRFLIYKILKILNKYEDSYKDRTLRNKCLSNSSSFFYKTANIYLLNNKVSSIIINKGSHIRGELLIFKYGGKIEIGKNCYIGEGSKIWSGERIKIGNNVLISHNVNIIDTNSHEINHIERAKGYINLIKNGHPKEKGSIITAPIIIDDYAWISFNVTILKGVSIGKGAIVAAGSIVTKNVDPFTLVGGNPAKFIKKTD